MLVVFQYIKGVIEKFMLSNVIGEASSINR